MKLHIGLTALAVACLVVLINEGGHPVGIALGAVGIAVMLVLIICEMKDKRKRGASR